MSPVPATISVTPTVINFVGANAILRNANFGAEIELFKDEDHTEPFDLTGWVVTMTRNGLPTLAVNEGLAIPTPVNGVVDILLTSAVTKSYPVGKYRHVLWVVKNTTRLAAVVGNTQVANP